MAVNRPFPWLLAPSPCQSSLMSTRVDQLAALSGFLDGTDYSGAALEACVRGMVDALTYEARNPAEARRIILDAIPSDRRAIVAAMLPEQARGRGRQKGSHSPKAARRAFALCEMYAFYKAKLGTANAAMELLAEIKDVDLDTIKRELPRARKLLSPYEDQLIRSVAELTAKS